MPMTICSELKEAREKYQRAIFYLKKVHPHKRGCISRYGAEIRRLDQAIKVIDEHGRGGLRR
ncbi:unnamed protein product [marine sediment metagenome]|uniref:Uncharacterized protein n=1 Tax=marine sediment metagenome TaxID=412755 RepID=X1P909_9ZZZZ